MGKLVEGFVKIERIEETKMTAAHVSKNKTDNAHVYHQDTHHHHHHHTTGETLQIAFYCRDVGRIPRIGRVLRMVESEADHEQKYFIELIK